jgi:ubiquinone/menaquinone biosynthesis C-methylase UbiE
VRAHGNAPLHGRLLHWQVIGVEPNLAMHPMAASAAERYGLDLRLVAGFAEALPLEDSSVDVVVGTMLMCSVSDMVASAREILRVLRPGERPVSTCVESGGQCHGRFTSNTTILCHATPHHIPTNHTLCVSSETTAPPLPLSLSMDSAFDPLCQ